MFVAAAFADICPLVSLIYRVCAIEDMTQIGSLPISPDFEIMVYIQLSATVPLNDNLNYQLIFDNSSTTKFCSDYRDRIVDVKFFPETTRISIWIDSSQWDEPLNYVLQRFNKS